MDKILKLLGLPEGATEEQIAQAIKALNAQNAENEKTIGKLNKEIEGLEKDNFELEEKLQTAGKPVPASAREKEILRRMSAGQLSREAAEMATDHQAQADKAAAAKKK